MGSSKKDLGEYSKRLLISRMRLLCNNGFYGMLLMHMKFGLDSECPTAYTDGHGIYFNPVFMDELSDSELDFVLMHEVLHAALRHCARGSAYNHEAFNIACDIVVNSNILLSNGMKKESITLREYGELMHLTPDGTEGYEFTAEEVYEMLPVVFVKQKQQSGSSSNSSCNETSGAGFFDDHSHWTAEGDEEDAKWQKHVIEAAEAIEIRKSTLGRGILPAFAFRMLNKLREPQIDWRAILVEFVQELVSDYSFLPPDRRFDGSDFFLPAFNETLQFAEGAPKKVVFMVDTSGSVSDSMIADSFSEITGAIDQFDGKLEGWLGFFDAAVYEPRPFKDVEDVLKMKPMGGGGTSFEVIFNYIDNEMKEDPPANIVILTDGYAPWPSEKKAMGIPVLWLINNNRITPPWGKVARIKAS